MSYSWLLGVFVGMLVGVGVVVVARWRRGCEEDDERARLIRAQSGAMSFYLTVLATLVGWGVDNVVAYRTGLPARVVSAWSVLLMLELLVWLGSSIWQGVRHSVWAELDARERKRARARAVVLLGGAAALSASTGLAFDRGQPGLAWFLVGFALLEVSIGLFLLYRSLRRPAG